MLPRTRIFAFKVPSDVCDFNISGRSWVMTDLTFEEGDAGGAGSEDCLNVNVYTPTRS